MFSCFRSIYRRIRIAILLFLYKLTKCVSDLLEPQFLRECRPLLTNAELLSFHRSPVLWHHFVQPITKRCRPRFFSEDFLKISNPLPTQAINEETRPKVFVCHDLAGNYRDDRFISGSAKWDDYRFYHWAGIDYFCYFSHNYITIPPLTWINAAHQNGVPIFGTFIVEFTDGEQILAEVLQSDHKIDQVIDAMVLITKSCGFDGWLINVECEVNPRKIPMLRRFVRSLTERIHDEIVDGKVFWYDSVIDTGKLLWQNELNEHNIGFFRDSDGILLNYAWNAKNLEDTVTILKNDAEQMAKVFVGIDVFGRGQVAKFLTRETVEQIKRHNFSIGIFAPAWTFERIDVIGLNPFENEGSDLCNQHFMRRNNTFWTMLWKHLYSSGPSALPFYTSFCLGSGKKKFRDGIQTGNEPWFNLMEQEFQPSVPSVFEYHFDEAYRGGSCIKFSRNVHDLRLFASDFPCDNNIIVSFVFKRSEADIQVQLVLNVMNEDATKYVQVICDSEMYGDSIESADIGQTYVKPLRGLSLQLVMIGLGRRQERTFSSSRPINGWETRYFYIKCADEVKASRVIDVGVRITKSHWTTRDYVLLGALYVQSGLENDHRIVSSEEVTIQSDDFCSVDAKNNDLSKMKDLIE